MKEKDQYQNIAERYDYMLIKNPERESFFKKIFEKSNIKSVLDCACGTGKDLVLFNSLRINVTGSDISESMLKIAQKRIEENGLKIHLFKEDYQLLESTFSEKFDAVTCLTNAINEPEVNVIKALNSMKNVLNENGIIVFDQGQTDSMMKNPPEHALEVNNTEFTRLFTMNYLEDIMTIKIFDLVHTSNENELFVNNFKVKIRLYDDWLKIIEKANLNAEIYGNWDFSQYNKESSKRLIIVARKK
jgi:ubiquinone/menaquinone biosynthesis C-methylase UbiE